MKITNSLSFTSAPWSAKAAWRMKHAAPVSGARPSLVLDLNNGTSGIGTTTRALSLLATCVRASAKLVTTSSGTIGSVSANTLALDVKSGKTGLSLEPERVNLALRSNDLSVSPWATTGSLVALVPSSAPDGGSMTRIQTNGPRTGDVAVVQNAAITLGQTYTVSAYVRRDQHRYAQLFGFGNGGNGVVYDLVAGTAHINSAWTSAGVEILNSTHARIWGVLTPITNGTAFFGLASDTLGNKVFSGSEALSFWGAQVEKGKGATSLAITTTASATRAKDLVEASLQNRWLGGAASVFLEFQLNEVSGPSTIAQLRSQNGVDVLTIDLTSTRNLRVSVSQNGVQLASVTGPVIAAGLNRILATVGDGLALSANGSALSVAPGAFAIGAGAILSFAGAGGLEQAPRLLTKALVFDTVLGAADAVALTALL